MTAFYAILAAGGLLVGTLIWTADVKRRAAAVTKDAGGVEENVCIPKLEQARVLKQAGIFIVPAESEREFIMGLKPAQNEYIACHPYYGFCIVAGSSGALNCIYSSGDRECIYQWDSYGRILKGLKKISELPLEEINGLERYKVTFRLDGKDYRWMARKTGFWLDTGLAGFLNRILDRQRSREGRRFYLDCCHEAPLYLFASEEMTEEINRKARLKFRLARAVHSV